MKLRQAVRCTHMRQHQTFARYSCQHQPSVSPLNQSLPTHRKKCTYSGRLGRSGSGEGRKLPLPTSLANALARDAPNSAGSEPNTHPPPGSGVGARGAGVGNGLRSRSNTVRSSSSELLHETEEPGETCLVVYLFSRPCAAQARPLQLMPFINVLKIPPYESPSSYCSPS